MFTLTQPQNFPKLFKELTGFLPFPWQEALFADFIEGKIPESANLPRVWARLPLSPSGFARLPSRPGKSPVASFTLSIVAR